MVGGGDCSRVNTIFFSFHSPATSRDAQPYYRHHVRQSFASHDDESDPARFAEIAARARADVAWLVDKYNAPSASSPPPP